MRCHACNTRTNGQWKVVQYSVWAESAISLLPQAFLYVLYDARSAKNVSNWPKFTSSMNINCHMGHPLVTINNYYHVQFMIASISTIRASSARSIHYLNITSVCIWGSGMHQIFFTHKRQPRIVCLMQKCIRHTPLYQSLVHTFSHSLGWVTLEIRNMLRKQSFWNVNCVSMWQIG